MRDYFAILALCERLLNDSDVEERDKQAARWLALKIIARMRQNESMSGISAL